MAQFQVEIENIDVKIGVLCSINWGSLGTRKINMLFLAVLR